MIQGNSTESIQVWRLKLPWFFVWANILINVLISYFSLTKIMISFDCNTFFCIMNITKYDAKYKGDFSRRLHPCEHLLMRNLYHLYDQISTKVEAYQMYCRYGPFAAIMSYRYTKLASGDCIALKIKMKLKLISCRICTNHVSIQGFVWFVIYALFKVAYWILSLMSRNSLLSFCEMLQWIRWIRHFTKI